MAAAPMAEAPVAYVPAPPPGYAPAHDPYHGRLSASAVPPALRGAAPLVPGYPPARPAVEPHPPLPASLAAPPAPRRANEMNIFQLAWDSAAATADGSDHAGPRLAAQEGPQPGEEDLFRRI
jgi:hypothetical protein